MTYLFVLSLFTLAMLLPVVRAQPVPSSNPPTSAGTFKSVYPQSTVIAGVTFDDSTARSEAPGSDIWPITWAADGHLYTPWGDGGGFGGTNQNGRVSFGVARVKGGKRDYVGENIAGGVNAPRPAPFTGKSEGIFALGPTHDHLHLREQMAQCRRARFRDRAHEERSLGKHRRAVPAGR